MGLFIDGVDGVGVLVAVVSSVSGQIDVSVVGEDDTYVL